MSAYLTANGSPVFEGSISMPRVGVWHADLKIDDSDASKFAGAMALSLADGALELTGTAYRSGASLDFVSARVAGGAGGMDKTVAPKAYQGVPLQLPLRDILSAAGEQLSATADAGVLATFLSKWVCVQQSAGFALSTLMGKADAAWRLLSDGKLWVGPEAWPESDMEYELLFEDPAQARWMIASDAPTILPGQTLAGRHVASVQHVIGPRSTRTVVWFEDA